MNSNLLTISTLLAAVAAFVILPMNAAASGIAFTVVGVLAVFASDYGRGAKAFGPGAEIVPFDAAGLAPARLDRAA